MFSCMFHAVSMNYAGSLAALAGIASKMRIPRGTLPAIKNVYDALAPRPVTRFKRRPVRSHFRARRISRRKGVRRTVNKRRIVRRKGARVSRGVPSLPRRTVYTRRRKGIRRGNVGVLQLQSRIQSGESLPEQTFARMYYRGSGVCTFTNSSSARGSLTWNLNDIGRSPWSSNSIFNTTTDPGLAGQIMYRDLWSSLYSQYIVLGATANFVIRPSVYPQVIANASTLGTDNTVPPNSMPGYYYARVYYSRIAGEGATNPDVIGYPITATGGGQERLWPHLRDFLSDTSVTWVKDPTSLRSKVHVHGPNYLQYGGTANVTMIPQGTAEGYTTSYELELSNRPIRLRVNFSAKKNFMSKNILQQGDWLPWGTQLSAARRFFVRLGYIGFTGDGTTSYHVPIDRNYERSIDANIRYFVGLRDPIPRPSMYSDEALRVLSNRIPCDGSESGDSVLSDIEADTLVEL